MTTHPLKSSADAVTRRRLLLGTTATCLLPPMALLSGCGGGAEVLFIPFISFTFDGTGPGNQPIRFFFGTDNPTGCAASGTFAANSNVSFNGASALLTGTFNGRQMNIKFAAAPAGLASAYTGEFTDDATVKMTPVGAGAEFNVVRQGLRPSTCPVSG